MLSTLKIQNYVLGVILGTSLAATLAVLPGNAIAQGLIGNGGNGGAGGDGSIANPSGANMTENMAGADEGIPVANTTAGPTGCIYTPDDPCAGGDPQSPGGG